MNNHFKFVLEDGKQDKPNNVEKGQLQILQYQAEDDKQGKNNKQITKRVKCNPLSEPTTKTFTFLKEPTNYASTINLPQASLPNLIAVANCGTKYYSTSRHAYFINLIEKLKTMIKQKEQYKIIKIYDNKQTNELNNQIINQFFKMGSTTFNLFCYTNFNIHNKSELLKKIIFSIGLIWMDNNEQNINLLKRLENELIDSFKSPSKLLPSIANLQALTLVILQLNNFTNTHMLRTSLLNLASRMTSLLGLHLSFYAKDYTLRFERKLLYSNLSFMLSFLDLTCGSHSSSPFKLNNKKVKPSKGFQAFVKHLNTKDKINLLFSDFLVDVSAIMFVIRIHKDNHSTNKMDLKNIQDQIHQLAQYYMLELDKISKQASSQVNIFHIGNLKKVIGVNKHYLLFFILCLFKHPNYFHSFEATDYHADVVLQAQLTIEFAIQLSQEYMPYFAIPMLAQSTAYLIHVTKDKNDINSMFIKKSIKKIKSLKLFLPLYWTCLANLGVLQLIMENKKL